MCAPYFTWVDAIDVCIWRMSAFMSVVGDYARVCMNVCFVSGIVTDSVL